MNHLKTSEYFNLIIYIWLLTITAMVLVIIVIGGLTRLTDSGLSMTDWRPLLGIIPPLNKNSWQSVIANSGHNIHEEAPEKIIENILKVIKKSKE